LGLRSSFALARDYPGLLSPSILLRHPVALFALSRRTDAAALRRLIEEVGEARFCAVLHRLLTDVRLSCLTDVVPSLLAAEGLHGKLVALLRILDAGSLAKVLNNVSANRLVIVLAAPTESITAFVDAVDAARRPHVIIALLQEPPSLVKDTLLPLLQQCQHPERLGAAANSVDVRVLVWMLRGVDARRLAAVVDALSYVDLEPHGGAAEVLQRVADDPEFVNEMLVPLLQGGDPNKIAPLLQGVRPEKILEVLRRVKVEDALLLLEHTNTEFAVQLFNGPLEPAVAAMAGRAAHALSNPLAATAHEHATDAVGTVLGTVDQTAKGVSLAIMKGKEQRGADAGSAYHFGDFTRGLIADAVERGRTARGMAAGEEGQPSSLLGDFSRGVAAQWRN